MHEPDAGGGAVEHADHWLGYRRIIPVARLPVGPAVHIKRRQVLGAPDVVGIKPFQRLHVRAGAKRAPRTGEHDDAHIVIRGRGFHGMAHVALHDRRPCVHPVGPVQRDGRDLLAHLIKNMLVAHCDLPVLVVKRQRVVVDMCFQARLPAREPFGRAR